jgi:hypothetical protein
MRKPIKLLAILVLVMAVFGQPTSASAGGGQAFNFKGPSILASFSNVSGCITTDVFVIASESLVWDKPGPGSTISFASVSISEYNNCTDTQLQFAYGSASPLTNFQVSKRLDSAGLHVTVTVLDEVSNTTYDVDVSLAWIGRGPVSRQHINSHFRAPGCITNNRFNSTSRSARASGSVSDGETNFTPMASVDASIDLVKSGSIVIGCN